MQNTEHSEHSFYDLGIAPRILDIIHHLKFVSATPIQHKAIPVALEGKDLIGVAQTGTGKTMAFVIPAVQRLAQSTSRALVLVPTRELAIQVDESAVKIARAFNIRTAVLIGGDSIHKQVQQLSRNPRILIATPGRLIDLLEQRQVRLQDISILVLDEADRMLDMGFAPQIERILKSVPRERQTLLFSATMPSSIVKIASAHMKIPVQVEVAPSGTAAEGVSHELFIISRDMKRELLQKLLLQYKGSVLLFCRTKIGVHKIVRALRALGHGVAEIHSDRTLGQRREALEGFKVGKYRILAATDVAARGIDVAGIQVVINYDLPDDAENYVHRIGRTGRAGKVGHAISLATPDQRREVQNIEKIIKMTLPISHHAEVSSVPFNKPVVVFSSRSMGRRARMASFRRRR